MFGLDIRGYSFLKRNLFFCAIVVNSILITCIICFLPVRFEENDDICMLLISSGSYTGVPDAHLVFINYIYGLWLKLLYSVWVGVEWYALSFVVLHIISISIVTFFVLKEAKNYTLKIILVLLFYSSELQILLHLQFTTTAALVCLAGIVLLLEAQSYHRIGGVVLCVVGSWLRLEIALVVIFISFPLFIKEVVQYKRLIISRPLAYLGAAILSIGLFEAVDQASYGEDSGWKSYLEFNKIRGLINDSPNAPALAAKLPQGIQPVDYALLLHFFQDGAVLNGKQLEVIAGKIKLASFTDKSSDSLFLYKTYFLLIGAVLLLSVISVHEQVDKLVLLATAFMFSLVVFVMAHVVSLKYRIFISALLPLVYSVCRTVRANGDFMSTKVLAFSLLLLLLYSSNYAYQFIGRNDYLKAKFLEQHNFIADYMVRSSNIIVPYAADYRIEGAPIFSVSRMHFKKRMFFGGWLTNIPLNNGVYTSHLDFTQGHSLFLRQASRNILPLIVEGIRVNYGLRVKPVIVAESEDDVIVEFSAL